MDYKKISQDVVDHVGGISNIKGATHCVTRLRLILNDETKYDRKALENIEGVKGVLFNSGQLMIIFGTGTVNNVYDAFIELTGVKEMSQSDAKAEGMSKMGKLQQGFKVFSDIFIPIIPAFVAAVIDVLYNSFGAFGAFVFAALLQPLVVTGTHQAIQGIEANLIATTGFNYIQGIWSVSIIAQGGGAIGMYLLAKKHSKDRDIAMSSFIPTLVGISEPAIFAANLKYSVIPFVCSCLGAGCGGAFMKLAGVRAIGQGLTGILGLLIVVPNKLVFYVIGNLIAFIVPIVLIVIYNKTKGVPHGEEEEEAESALTIDETAKVPVKAVVDGKVIAIEDVKDGIFSEKVLGDGVGIIPTSETVLAPAEGEICTVMEGSKHAIGVRTTNNSVFLIHVGIETVSMNGEGFEYLVKKGQHVKEGQPILKFDKAKIEAKGLNPVVVFVKTDEGNQTPMAFKTGINVKAGKDVIGE